jgi:hypothetical protein
MTIEAETRFAVDTFSGWLWPFRPPRFHPYKRRNARNLFPACLLSNSWAKCGVYPPVLLPNSHPTPRIPLVFLCSEHLSGLEPCRMALRSVRARHATPPPTVWPLNIPCSIQLLPPGTQRVVRDREDEWNRNSNQREDQRIFRG